MKGKFQESGQLRKELWTQGGGQEQGVVKGVALEDAVRVEEGVGAEQTQGTGGPFTLSGVQALH